MLHSDGIIKHSVWLILQQRHAGLHTFLTQIKEGKSNKRAVVAANNQASRLIRDDSSTKILKAHFLNVMSQITHHLNDPEWMDGLWITPDLHQEAGVGVNVRFNNGRFYQGRSTWSANLQYSQFSLIIWHQFRTTIISRCFIQ